MGAEQLEGTRGRILEEVARSPRTAHDLALSLGIQESAARGHLERLEERGIVLATFYREGVGRPRKRYALTPEGQELFPKRYELLLDAVVEELLDREGEEFVVRLFGGAARRMARQVAQRVDGSPAPEARARSLVDALNDLGFRCTLDRDPEGNLRIVRTNCVFRHTALTHSHLLCDVFDRQLTRALLGELDVDLQDSIGRGGVRCTHLIRLA
jgi:predicted ArsR family transcriptional regulator